MTESHISELIALARKWGDEGKEDLAHHALDVIGREAEEPEGQACPHCGADGERIEDTSTGGEPRLTCKGCGKSWNPREVVANG